MQHRCLGRKVRRGFGLFVFCRICLSLFLRTITGCAAASQKKAKWQHIGNPQFSPSTYTFASILNKRNFRPETWAWNYSSGNLCWETSAQKYSPRHNKRKIGKNRKSNFPLPFLHVQQYLNKKNIRAEISTQSLLDVFCVKFCWAACFCWHAGRERSSKNRSAFQLSRWQSSIDIVRELLGSGETCRRAARLTAWHPWCLCCFSDALRHENN